MEEEKIIAKAQQKIKIYYKAKKEKYKKAVLIDLRKAFDMVNREILKTIINKNINDNYIKRITLNLIDLYDMINLNIEGKNIYNTEDYLKDQYMAHCYFAYI